MRRSFVSPPSRRAAVSSSSVAFVVSSAFAVSAMFAGCSIYDPSLLVDAPPDYSGYAGADSEGGTGGTDSEGGTGGTDSEGGTGGTDSEGGTGGTESGGTGGTETTGGTGGSAAGTGGTASGSGGVSGNSGTGGSSGSAAGTGGASGKGGSSGGSAGATGGTAGAGGTAGTGGSTAGTGGAAGAPGGSGGSAGATGGSGGSAGATGGSGGSAGATGGSGGSAGASGGAGGSAGGGSGCTGIVLINEVSVEGPASKADDFVELYNPNDCEVSLDGWTLKYAASSATAFQTSVLWTGTATTILAPHGYYVLGGSSYAPAGTADATMKSGITTPAGVGLFNKDGGDPVDRVAWGNVDVGTHPAVETAPAPAPVGYKSIGRSSASKDTDNNAVDFTGQDRSPGAANP